MNCTFFTLLLLSYLFTVTHSDTGGIHHVVSRHEDDDKISLSKRGCSYRVSWQAEGNKINFAVKTTPGPPHTPLWVALGLSTTSNMPNTVFVACWSASDQIVVLKTGETIQYKIKHIDKNQTDVTLVEGGWTNGEFYCNFTWRVPIDEQKYLIMANGRLSGPDPSMERHTSTPSVTSWSSIVDDASNSEDGEILLHCDCYPSWKIVMIRFHGAIMALTFLLSFPLGIMTARHFKSIFEGNIWFKIHTRLMVLGVASVVVATVFALVHTSGALHLGIHQVFGAIFIPFVLLQPVVALFRPHPNPLDAKRKVFNLFHRTLGISILSLGVLECFLGVYTLQVDFREVLYILLALATIGLITFAVVFEYAQSKLRTHSTSARYSKIPMDGDDSDAASEGVAFVDTEPSAMTKTSSSDTSAFSPQCMNALYYLFVLSVFTMTGLFVAFLFYEIP